MKRAVTLHPGDRGDFDLSRRLANRIPPFGALLALLLVPISLSHAAPIGSFDGATPSLMVGQTLGSSGWAADFQYGSPVSSVRMYVNNVYRGNATLNVSRNDVAAAYNIPDWDDSGWNWNWNTSVLSAGQHTVKAYAYNAANQSTLIGSKNFTLTANSVPVPSISIEGLSHGTAATRAYRSPRTVRVHYGATDANGNLSGIRWNIWHPASGYFSNGTGGFVPQSGSSGEVVKDFDLELDGDWYFWTDAQDAVGAYASTGHWQQGFHILCKSNMPAGFGNWRDVDYDGLPDQMLFPGDPGFDVRVDDYFENCYPVNYYNINNWWDFTQFWWPDNNDDWWALHLLPDFYYWEYQCAGYGKPTFVFNTEPGYQYILYEDLASLPGVFVPGTGEYWIEWVKTVFGGGSQEYTLDLRYIVDIVYATFFGAKVSKPASSVQITSSSGAVLGELSIDSQGQVSGSVNIPVGSTKITIRIKDILGNILSGQAPIEWVVNGLPIKVGGSIDLTNPGDYTITAGYGDHDISITLKVGGVQFMGYDPAVFETKVNNGTLTKADLTALSELKVAKWMNENGVYGSDVTRDPDHFVVRVYDPDAKGAGTVNVSLETTKSDLTAVGDSTYTDDPDTIPCIEEPANSGMFYSRELILRSDTVDDNTPGSGTPFVNDNFTNDRSHIVHLGGTVKARYPATGTEKSRGEVPVNVREAIDVEIVIFRKTPGGTQTADLSDVQARWKVVQERYAQLGIWVNYTIRNNGYIDPHPAISLGNGVTIFDETAGPGKLTSEVHAIVDHHGVSSSDVVVFYVNDLVSDTGSNPLPVIGFAAMPIRLSSTETDYENIIMINGDKDGSGEHLFTAPHELAHLLMNGDAEDNGGDFHHSDLHNILYIYPSDSNTTSATKRFDRYEDEHVFDTGNSNAQSLF